MVLHVGPDRDPATTPTAFDIPPQSAPVRLGSVAAGVTQALPGQGEQPSSLASSASLAAVGGIDFGVLLN